MKTYLSILAALLTLPCAALGDTVAAWGDSLTAGSGGTPWPTQFATLTGVTTLNRGVGGNTSTQIKDRFLAEPARFGDYTVIWAGRNNYTDPATVKADIATMVASLTTTHYLVLSVINGNYGGYESVGGDGYNFITGINADLAATYGSRFIDVRSLLVNAYNPSDAQDVSDFARNIVPTSLRATLDNIHLNTAGYAIVANAVKAAYSNSGAAATRTLLADYFESDTVGSEAAGWFSNAGAGTAVLVQTGSSPLSSKVLQFYGSSGNDVAITNFASTTLTAAGDFIQLSLIMQSKYIGGSVAGGQPWVGLFNSNGTPMTASVIGATPAPEVDDRGFAFGKKLDVTTADFKLYNKTSVGFPHGYDGIINTSDSGINGDNTTTGYPMTLKLTRNAAGGLDVFAQFAGYSTTYTVAAPSTFTFDEVYVMGNGLGTGAQRNYDNVSVTTNATPVTLVSDSSFNADTTGVKPAGWFVHGAQAAYVQTGETPLPANVMRFYGSSSGALMIKPLATSTTLAATGDSIQLSLNVQTTTAAGATGAGGALPFIGLYSSEGTPVTSDLSGGTGAEQNDKGYAFGKKLDATTGDVRIFQQNAQAIHAYSPVQVSTTDSGINAYNFTTAYAMTLKLTRNASSGLDVYVNFGGYSTTYTVASPITFTFDEIIVMGDGRLDGRGRNFDDVTVISQIAPPPNNFAAWAASKGITGEPAGGDYDHDGLSNLVEYALDLDPKASTVPAGSFAGSLLSFTKGAMAKTDANVQYAIEASSNLTTWDVVVPNNPGADTISYTLAPPYHFSRLRVTQTP